MFDWIRSIFNKRSMAYEDGVNAGLCQPRTAAGIPVDEQTALSLTAVWCAVSTISSLIAGLPLRLYQHVADGKRLAREHPLYELLNDSPNPEITKEAYWQAAIAHVLLHGNHYAEVERDGQGRPVALWILPPLSVVAERDPEIGLYYRVKVSAGKDVILAPESVFHVAGLSGDGLTGYSPIRLARESLAMTAACDRFGASFFGNSARPAGVLQTAGVMSPNARENLRKSWAELHAGSGNTGRTAILEEGVTWQSISIPAEDAQFLETRQYQIQEIARLYMIPCPYLGDLSRATWANLTELSEILVQVCLTPIAQKIEGQIRKKLLSEEERRLYFAEHDFSKLLQGKRIDRFNAYKIALNNKPWMLPSEVREAERLDPIIGIDDDPEPPPPPPPVQPPDQPSDQPPDQKESDGAQSDSQPDQDQ